jgi:glycosyltransferase involved in cell wall biosynthesis
MKLSVILIHYKENEETVSHSLGILDIQKNFNLGDCEIIIVDDGPEAVKLSQGFLDSFKHLKKHNCIKYLTSDYITKRPFNTDQGEPEWKNGGPGLARQYGIDHASGDYVTCIDIDDNFHNAYVLSFFNEMIYPSGLDFITTDWVSPIKTPEGKWVYPVHNQDLTWEFGKFYRRAFLKEAKLRHSDELRVHEDSYFLRIVAPSTDKKTHINYMTYVWNQSEDSITRQNGAEYAYTSFATYIRANDLVLKEKKIRKRDELIQDSVQNLIYYYYSIHNPEWEKDEAKEWLELTEKMCSYFYYQWEEYFSQGHQAKVKNQQGQEVTIDLISDALKSIQVQASHKPPNETFDTWLDRIKSLEVKELPFYPTATIEIEKRGVSSE